MTKKEKREETCGPTHYEGCPCHEARRNAEVARLRRVARVARTYLRTGARGAADELGELLAALDSKDEGEG